MTVRGILLATLLVLAGIATWATNAAAVDALYLVRHAEKQSDWPSDPELASMQPLSAQGLRRATGLPARFEEIPLVAMLSSPTTRTLHTGLFTAGAQGLEVTVEPRTIDRDAIPALLDELRATHPGPGAILVVGHSNTIPWFFDAVGVDPSCHARLGVTIESYGPATTGYDGLWEIDPDARGCDAVTRHEFVPDDRVED